VPIVDQPPPTLQQPVRKPGITGIFQEMPVWGWLILLGGIVIVVYYFHRQNVAAATTTGSLPVNTAAGTDTGLAPALTADQTQWQGDFQALIDQNSGILSLLQSGQNTLPSLPSSDPISFLGPPTAGDPTSGGAGVIDTSGSGTLDFTPNPIGAIPYLQPSDQGNPGTVIADQPLNNGASTGAGPAAGNIVAAIPLTSSGPVLPPDLPSWFVPFGSAGAPASPVVQAGIETGVGSAYGTYPSASQFFKGPPLPAPTLSPAPISQSFGVGAYTPKVH
jgi:hypothetical protein